MPEDLFSSGVAFLGEDVFLYVEANDFFAPDVTVTFEGTHTLNSPRQPTTLTFTEKLTAQPSKLRDPKKAKGKKATRIPWKVNINKNTAFRGTTVLLKYKVSGKAASGVNMLAVTQDHIVIGALRVTTDPKLTRIMVHEFAQASGNTFVFNPAPLETYLTSLTGQQKRTLYKHAIAKPEGRLVVFITLYPKKDLRMFADYCEADENGMPLPRHCVRPNATFSVFHCFDPLKGGVTLVCHTEHFVLNLKNYLGPTKKVKHDDGSVTVEPRTRPDTWVWMHSWKDGKRPNDWLAKNNPRPIQYKIASEFPQERNDGVIWSRIFTPGGYDIMLGNTMHGAINTVGCWMLFRNYNWPESIAVELDRIFRNTMRAHMWKDMPKELRNKVFEKVRKELAEKGYNALKATQVDKDSPMISSSLGKFLGYDSNYAYIWFFHEIVGIKYFSATEEYGGNFVNDITSVDAHSSTVSTTFDTSKGGLPPAFNLPDEGFTDVQGRHIPFAYHNWGQRKAKDPSFVPENSLWRVNAMGFQTAQGFIPKNRRGRPEAPPEFTDLSAAEIDRFSWADLYLYREDAVNFDTLTTNNYSESDVNV
jgi:hypothetical protein